ncbi:MAG: hypothetical protein U0L26_01770 [Cellulosilyticum sp.]|nr:hypothetical protein [Cellulosilyticum sp.]
MADIKKLIKDINKKFGANAIRLGSDIKQDMNFKIPLGSVGLNDALGGGLPSGRYITLAGQESSGKSFLAYKAIATVQAMKKKTVTDSSGFEYEIVAEDGDTPLQAALIQIESGSYTKEWGDYLGIDNDSLIFCQPEGMEQALDIAIALQQAGVEFIVIDSIAAMLPTKEIETDLVDTVQMGLRAKALNSYHGKFQSFNNTLERTGHIPTTVLAINQFRDKIGGYGDTTTCLHGETNVVFTDGRTFPIEKVVKEKIQGKVWSFNEDTQKFEECEILDWVDNGVLPKGANFYTITTEGIGSKNGRYSVTATADHEILTSNGWKFACDVNENDYLVTNKCTILNGTLLDFIAGTLVADCSLSKNFNTARLVFQDSNNEDYLNWKVSKLSKAFNFNPLKGKHGTIYTSNYTVELGCLKEKLINRDVKFFIDNFSDLGLAVYYMDDGHLDLDRGRACFSLKRFKGTKTLEMVADFFNSIGIECSAYMESGKVQMTVKGSDELFKRIYKYVPEPMQYKLPLKYRGKYQDFELTFEKVFVPQFTKVISANVSSKRKFRNKHLYDLKVANNHNFIAGGTGNGIVVHNCPGGNSQKYTNSLEIRTRVGDYLKEGTGANAEIVGRVVKWKIQKNKTGAAFVDGEYDFYTKDGMLPKGTIDTAKELVVLAVVKGVVERRGAWFYFNGENVAQGQDNLIQKLREDKEMFLEIVGKL